MTIDPQNPILKILIVRVGRLGDIVMTTPALGLIKETYPNAQFDLLIGNEGAPLIPFLPIKIYRIYRYNRKSMFQAYIRSVLRKRLAENVYDHIFCFETGVQFKKLLPPNNRTIYCPQSGNEHACQSALNVVNRIAQRSHEALDKTAYPLSLLPEPALIRSTENYFLEKGIGHDTFVVALHPSFSGTRKPNKIIKRFKHKKWRDENYARLAEKIDVMLTQQGVKHRVVMNLLPEDRRIGGRIKKLAGDAVDDFFLPQGFQYFMGYLHRVDLLIVPDTGPMHMATALNTNVVALFSGERPDRCGPWSASPGAVVIRAEDIAGGKSGINRITPDYVAHAIKKNMPTLLKRTYLQRKPNPENG